MTSDPATMTEEVEAFYMNLYKAEACCRTSVMELLDNLPQLSPADRDTLGSTVTLARALNGSNQIAPGKSPGLDGLRAEFLKHFCFFLRHVDM